MRAFSTLFLAVLLLPSGIQQAAGGPASHASGGGTYLLGSIRTEFQFSNAHVQCKIGHGVFPDGTVIQMFMKSQTIDSFTINSTAKTVAISGTMLSSVSLRSPDGTSAEFSESVPFTAFAQDNATPGAGADVFSVTVIYANTPNRDQFDLFGSPATFDGTVETGDIVIR